MEGQIKRATDQSAIQLWSAVGKAAQSSPEWMRKQVSDAAKARLAENVQIQVKKRDKIELKPFKK